MNKTIFTLILLLGITFTVFAQKYDDEKDFTVEIIDNGNAVQITKYVGNKNVVSIPSKIQNLPVIEIGDWAFSRFTNLTSVTIPNSVTEIGKSAFSHCRSLKSITIPKNITSIKEYTFYGCTSLKSITIPKNVTSIERSAFSHCDITSVTIPNSVTSIGVDAFDHCISLIEINVVADNNAYTAEDGILYNKNKTVLVVYPAGKTGAFIIPINVTNIGDNAFSGCANLTSVTIPDSVTNIGNYAFFGCTSLTSVTFKGLISSFNVYAFGSLRGDYDLRNVYLGKDGGPGIYKRATGSEIWKKQ